MKQIDPGIGRYLQMRIRAWMQDGDRTARDLANVSGLKDERVSKIRASGQAGWDSAAKLAKVFGFKDMAALLVAAEEWSRHEPPPPASTASIRLPTAPSERLALACAIAREDGAADAAIASVMAEAHTLEGESVLRIAIRIARRNLEMADGSYQAPKARTNG